MKWYLQVVKQFANFKGRAGRTEFWMFVLFNLIFTILAAILDNAFGIVMDGVFYGPIYGIYASIVAVPNFAVAVRRLHDIGKSGWMTLVALIPLIGAIWLIVLFSSKGNLEENKYGAMPISVK